MLTYKIFIYFLQFFLAEFLDFYYSGIFVIKLNNVGCRRASMYR